jgi:hypothetical protein
MKNRSILILCTFFLCFQDLFSQESYLEIERKFKTDNQLSQFHLFASPEINLKQNFDGIILGFEKISNNKISSNKQKLDLTEKEKIYNSSYTKYWDDKYHQDKTIKRYKQIKSWNKKILQDKKSMVLTHWLKVSNMDYSMAYNIYDNELYDKDYNLYRDTKSQLDSVKVFLQREAINKKYTHIILMNTGWNNNQFNSVSRYNDWLKVISDAAKTEGKPFKPFFIGITWPSFWSNTLINKPMIDMMNKANDADELGITHVNYLLWKVLMPVSEQTKIPLVLIGHSFGAKILTRASHSSMYFNETVNCTKKIDLMLAFQGAYLTDRHLDKSLKKNANKTTGVGLYIENNPCKMFVATTSGKDYAMNSAKVAKFGLYMGKDDTYTEIHNNHKSIFQTAVVDSSGYIDISQLNDKPIVLKADNIIWHKKSNKKTGSGAHGDVSNKECGVLIWQLIEKYANTKKY